MAFINQANQNVNRLNIEKGFFLDEIGEEDDNKSAEDAQNVGKLLNEFY